MVIGLLLLALVALILGLVLASAPFLIGSLVASLVAGFLLWRQREQMSGRSNRGSPQSTTSAAEPATGGAASGAQSEIATRPRALVTGIPVAAQTTSVAAPSDRPDGGGDSDVWVVDGQPRFHTQSCTELAGYDSEPIPLGQAVEDGFTECASCQVAAAPAAATSSLAASPDVVPPAAGGAVPSGVWVVDGRPRYHLVDCMIIIDQDAEEIPLAQATEDGFIPCTMCEPNVTRV